MQQNTKSLRFAFIGQAYPPVSIPPAGWGAVESVIWDYKIHLEQLGHEVVIINTADHREIIAAVKRCQPDIVHLHQAPLSGVLNKIRAPVKIFTNHSGYAINQRATVRLIAKHFFLYARDGLFVFVPSPVWRKVFIACGYNPAEVFVTFNGADRRKFKFRQTPPHKHRSIYLGLITDNKRQHLYQTIASIDFAGPHKDKRFDQTRDNYLGEWTREYLYQHLSDYANLVLLSKSESAPLVVLEALVCGLGVVVSAGATANLDTRLPWITVIPEEKITDVDFVADEIARNREIALRHREQIREYGIENFAWEKLVPRYADLCRKLYDEKMTRQGFAARCADACRRLPRALPALRKFTPREYASAFCPLWLRRLLRPPPPPRDNSLAPAPAWNWAAGLEWRTPGVLARLEGSGHIQGQGADESRVSFTARKSTGRVTLGLNLAADETGLDTARLLHGEWQF